MHLITCAKACRGAIIAEYFICISGKSPMRYFLYIVTWFSRRCFCSLNTFYNLNGIVFTARKRSLGQGNILSSVGQEFCSQEGGLPQCMLGFHTPWTRYPPDADHPGPGTLGADPPRADTPPDQAPPPLRSAYWEIR